MIVDGLPQRRVVAFGDPTAPTAEERRNINVQFVVILTVLGTLAILCLVVEGYFNLRFMATYGRTPEDKILFGVVSVIFTLAVCGLPLSFSWLKQTDPLLYRIIHSVWIACFAVSILSALGYVAANKGQRIFEASNNRNVYGDAKAALGTARANLAALPPHRIEAAVIADIAKWRLRYDGILARTRKCTEEVAWRERGLCDQYLGLQAELNAARAAGPLEARIDRLTDKAEAASEKPQSGDPQAEQMAWMTRGLVSTEDASRGATTFIAIVLETLAATVMLAISRSISGLMTARALAQNELAAQHMRLSEIHEVLDVEAQNPFEEWARRACVYKEGAWKRAADLYNHHAEWCGLNDFQPLKKSDFGAKFGKWAAENNILRGHSGARGGTYFENIELAPIARQLMLVDAGY